MFIIFKTRPTICASSRGNTDGSALMVLNGRIGYAAVLIGYESTFGTTNTGGRAEIL